MKLVFLAKRSPQGRDLIARPYGRFFHLPRLLAARGHEVHVALLSHGRMAPLAIERDGVHWLSDDLFGLGAVRYVAKVDRLVRETRPDWIVGLSDTYYGVLAERLARKHRARSLIDAYDNYEGYLPWCMPLHALWRRALARATALSAAGPMLARLMTGSRDPAATFVAPMAPDPVGFGPLPAAECRSALGLPAGATLIGYCGAVAPNRGIEVLFEAMDVVKQALPHAHLVLSGRKHAAVRLPADATWLGYLPDEKLPALLNCMNVLTVINRESTFGQHSHPIKLYEAMSCQVPAVATRTLATEWILASHPELLAAPGDPSDLAAKVIAAAPRERIDYGPVPTWEQVALDLEAFLQGLAPTA